MDSLGHTSPGSRGLLAPWALMTVLLVPGPGTCLRNVPDLWVSGLEPVPVQILSPKGSEIDLSVGGATLCDLRPGLLVNSGSCWQGGRPQSEGLSEKKASGQGVREGRVSKERCPQSSGEPADPGQKGEICKNTV